MNALEYFKNTLLLEAKALEQASSRLEPGLCQKASELLINLKNSGGTLFFCGVGKSGLIGEKLASTFSSLGLKSYLLHPTEALHGDLGRVSSNDTVVLISKSGTTEEIVKLMPYLPVPKEQVFGLLGRVDSPLGDLCDFVLDCSVEKEACLNNQAPTTSSTLAMAMGDALAVSYEALIGLSKEGFAQNHPGGILGKSLRLKVEHLFHQSGECAVGSTKTTLKEALVLMSQYPMGIFCCVDDSGKLEGIFVDGDMRRALAQSDIDLNGSVLPYLNKKPVTVGRSELAMEAFKLMETGSRKISVIPVLDREEKFVGVIRLHDLLSQGLS